MTDEAETIEQEGDEAPQAPPAPKRRGGDDVSDEEAAGTVEAILFASETPLSASRIAHVGELPQGAVKRAIETLTARYEAVGSAFRIEEIAGGYQVMTCPEYNDVVSRLFESRKDTRLSQAALETLAITAYRQPILRADIEAIRGVACGEVLRGLMEKQLVKIVGRAEVIGRPMLYGTTKRFLEVFGLKGLDDLPKVEELRSGDRPIPEKAQPDQPSEESDDDEEEVIDEEGEEEEEEEEYSDEEDDDEDEEDGDEEDAEAS